MDGTIPDRTYASHVNIYELYTQNSTDVSADMDSSLMLYVRYLVCSFIGL